MEEQNPQLTTGLSLFYHRLINRTKSLCYKKPVASKTRTYHRRVGRRARRSGWERSGKIGCRQNDLPRKRRSTVLSKASENIQFNVSPESSDIGLHRISFFRALEETSRTVSPIRWLARERVVSWPDRPDGVPSYPAPPPLAAPPCAAPIRPPVVCPGF